MEVLCGGFCGAQRKSPKGIYAPVCNSANLKRKILLFANLYLIGYNPSCVYAFYTH